ncbi:MAG TPA: hypothetical protein VMJ70_15470 [Candidatus Sulfotelmatobacter sp.]|nr:hypothetical protein [Candidatus Sulfotelmatobacter sp.]
MKHLLMKGRAAAIASVAILCAAASLAAGVARAETTTDLRAGVFMDENAVGFGAGVLTPMGSETRWYFNPNLEFGVGDHENIVTMNGDFHYDLPQRSRVSVWMGAGPAVVVQDPDEGSSRTDLGLNVLTGVGGTSGSVRPYAQLKGVLADQGQVVLQGGIRF